MELLTLRFQSLHVHRVQERLNLLLVKLRKFFLQSGMVGTGLLRFSIDALFDDVEGVDELAKSED